MSRMQNKLSAKAVEAARFAGRPYKLFDGGGLFLHVQRSGSYWRLKYRFDGKERLLALGVYPDTTLSSARSKRNEARELLANGKNPNEERQAEKAARAANAETFEAVAHEWLALQRKKLSEETHRLARRRLERFAFPAIGKRRIRDLEAPEVLRLLRRIESKGQHETAHRVRQRIGQVFRFAIASGRADRDPTADLKGALAPVASTSRSAITNPGQVGRLVRAIDGYTGQPTTWAALQLLALTFVRPGELRKAEWHEIDLDGATWRIPAARMKMGREQIVPLSRQAVDILRELERITGNQPFVFESTRPKRPISDNTVNAALRTLGYSGKQMTAHGFRAMASTLLHELGWPPEVIELQLAHAQRSQVAAAYNRSARLEERRRMMVAWADYLDGLRRDTGSIVSIHDARGVARCR